MVVCGLQSPGCADVMGNASDVHQLLTPAADTNAVAPYTVQVDTKDILFVVGGAFVDLERQLMDSRHKSSIGFGNKVNSAAGIAETFTNDNVWFLPAHRSGVLGQVE